MTPALTLPPPAPAPAPAPPQDPYLSTRLEAALGAAAAGDPSGLELLAAAPVAVDARARVLSLLTLYDLQTGPLRPVARWARHPAVARLQWALESAWLDELAAVAVPDDLPAVTGVDSVVAALRALAARERLPAVYRWVARQASYDEVVSFLALEGGPDAGFDDLVAACQVGLTGRPKLELGINYWDELGNGSLGAVHTTLHDQMAAALGMPRLPLAEQPVEGLERVAYGGLLAANHWLQPEMLGALGLTELQAGPRCRLVLQAFQRVGAPAAAWPFYEVHAEVDPRHGRDWVEGAVVPLVEEHPDWAPRVVRGAWWRSLLNRRFFDVAAATCQPSAAPATR